MAILREWGRLTQHLASVSPPPDRHCGCLSEEIQQFFHAGEAVPVQSAGAVEPSASCRGALCSGHSQWEADALVELLGLARPEDGGRDRTLFRGGTILDCWILGGTVAPTD